MVRRYTPLAGETGGPGQPGRLVRSRKRRTKEKSVQTRQSMRQKTSRAAAVLGVAIAALSAAGAYAAIPKVLVYQDSDGIGQITITPFAPDPATGGDKIQVQLKQNGNTFSGTGYQVRIEEANPNVPDSATVDLINFNLRD